MTEYISKVQDEDTGQIAYFKDSKAHEDIETLNTQFKDIVNEIGDVTLNTTAQDIKGAINEVFQSASNGKRLIAQAITGKGVDTNANDSFQTMATNISRISSGINIEGKTITVNNTKYKLSINSDGDIIATIVKHTVTNNLSNATNNNISTEIDDNSSYNSTISANSGYRLSSITVTMGGTDITSSVYSNGVINISNVTGNIVITVTTEVDADVVVGNIDSDNNIILTGLSTGTYTLKYEDINENILSDYDNITTMEVV